MEVDLTAQHPDHILGAAPSHETLLGEWAALNGDLTALCARHSLSGLQLIAFLEDQTIAPRRTAIDAALTQSTIRRLNNHAGEALIRAINNDGDPVELRRAATVLCRIARYYEGRPPRGTALQSSASPGGTALQSSASSGNPAQPTTPPPDSTTTDSPPIPQPRPTAPAYTAKALLLGLLNYVKDPIAAAERGERPSFRFAVGATLDHVPISPEDLSDAARRNALFQNSTFGDIDTRDFELLPDPFLSDTAAIFQVLYPSSPNFPDSITATFHLSRTSTFAPWLLADISSTARPAPAPCASSP